MGVASFVRCASVTIGTFAAVASCADTPPMRAGSDVAIVRDGGDAGVDDDGPDVPGEPDVMDVPALVDAADAGIPWDTADASIDANVADSSDAAAAVDADPALRQRSCAAAGTAGCGMVAIDGGTFTMGTDTDCNLLPDDPACSVLGAPPQPSVTVGRFAIDRFEVTVARFRAFMAAGAPEPGGGVRYRGATLYSGLAAPSDLNCSRSANYPRSDREDHPVNCVGWGTALAFCAWDGGRLPTEAEWEFAARGVTGRRYPWGSADTAAGGDRACWTTSSEPRTGTCAVGTFSPRGDTPEGVHDLSGNVWEWTADWFDAYGPGGVGCWRAVPVTDPLCTRPGTWRTARGGGWGTRQDGVMRSASRTGYGPDYPTGNIGFRCARDLE